MANLASIPYAGTGDVIFLWLELLCSVVISLVTFVISTPFIFWVALRGLFWGSTPKKFRGVLITGASGGIGKSLAEAYAGPGVTMTLTGRRAKELEESAKICRAQGAEVEIAVCDVTDRDRIQAVVEAADSRFPLDLIIANAGIISETEGFSGSRKVIDVNVQGALNTVLPAVPLMKERKNGQILFMSSLGAFAPPTNAYMMSYLASKAAVNQFAGGMRAALAPDYIGVTVATFGYVESEMTVGKDSLKDKGVDMPGLVTAKEACRKIQRGVALNSPMVMFPFWLYLITRVLGALPPVLRDWILPSLVDNDPFMKVDRLYATGKAGQPSK